MNVLARMLAHDAWTTRVLLQRCAELSDAQLDCEHPIGLRTIRRTLQHIVHNTDIWSALMAGHSEYPHGTRSEDGPRGIEDISARHEVACARLASVAAGVEACGAWDRRFPDPLETPPGDHSFGGAIAHVLTHSMHHRAQLLWMMGREGMESLPEGDVLSWEQAELPPPPPPTLALAVPLLRMKSWRASEAHYGKLGFRTVAENRSGPGDLDPAYLVLERDGVWLQLSSHAGDGVFGSVANLIVPDVDSLYREFVARGVEFAMLPTDQTWGNREMYVRDPDGNTLRFLQVRC